MTTTTQQTPRTGTAAYMNWLLTNDPQAHRAILRGAHAAASADGDSFEAFMEARTATVSRRSWRRGRRWSGRRWRRR